MTMLNQPRFLKFPPTRTILWDKTPCGEAVDISLSQSRVQVLLADTLWQNETLFVSENPSLVFNGSVSITRTVTGNEVQLKVNDVDNGNENINGYCLIPCKVKHGGGDSPHFDNDFMKTKLIKKFNQFCKTTDLHLAALFPCCCVCYRSSDDLGIITRLHFMCLTCDNAFQAVPVAPVPIICTALSRSLLLEMQQGCNIHKSGFLSMNETRHLLLVLEKDPKACSLPLVGVWISGVHDVRNAFVVAACKRYCESKHLKHRVCVPPEPFLIVLYVHHSMKPKFYDCTVPVTNNEDKLLLFKGSVTVGHKKINGWVNPYSTEVLFDLQPDEALYSEDVLEGSCHSSIHNTENNTDANNEVPRPTPKPLESEVQEVLSTPSVPDLSLVAENGFSQNSVVDSVPCQTTRSPSAAPLQGHSRLPELLQKVQYLLQKAPRSVLQDTEQQTELSESALLLASLEKERIAVDISTFSSAVDQPSSLNFNETLNLMDATSKYEVVEGSLLVGNQNKNELDPGSNNISPFLDQNPFCSSPANTVSPLRLLSNCSSTSIDRETCDCLPINKKQPSNEKHSNRYLKSDVVQHVKKINQEKLVNDEVLVVPCENRILQSAHPTNTNFHIAELEYGRNAGYLANNQIKTIPKAMMSKDSLVMQRSSSEGNLPKKQECKTTPQSQNTVNHRYPSRMTEMSLGNLTLGEMPLATISDQPPSPPCTIHLDLKEYPDSVQESEFGSTIISGNLQTNNNPAESTEAFYQKILGKVQWMLYDESSEQRNAVCCENKDKFYNPEPAEQETYPDFMNGRTSPLQNSCLDLVMDHHNRLISTGSLLLPQLNYVSLYNSPDVSFRIGQLARKYLGKESCEKDSAVNCIGIEKTSVEDVADIAMSFATCQYLEKHGLLCNISKSKPTLYTECQQVPEEDTNDIAVSFATRQYLQRYNLLQAALNTTQNAPVLETVEESDRSKSVESDKVNILNIAKLRDQPKLF